MRRRGLAAVAGLMVAMLGTGCDRDRVAAFGTFAAAGSAYAAEVQGLVTATGDAMVASDSATLVAARAMEGDAAGEEPAAARKTVATEDVRLRQYLLDLQEVDRHAALLGEYFDALAAATNGKGQAAAMQSADGLLDAVNALNPKVERARFGGASVQQFVRPATALVVAHVLSRGLDRDLRRAAPVIDRALGLQEAAVAAMTEQLHESVAATLAARETAEVVGPYAAKGPLPANWAERRQAYLRTSVAVEEGAQARESAAALHAAFRRLVAGGGSAGEMRELLRAVEGLSEYTAVVRQGGGSGSEAGAGR